MMQAAPIRSPDVAGLAARAWRIREKEARAALGAYLVHAPLSHPFWPWKVVSLIVLRDVPGVRAAVIDCPGATHELAVIPLDPSSPVGDPDASGPFHFLRPIDVVEQFTCSSDERARELLEELMRYVADGSLIPDSDFRSIWHAAVGAALDRKA